MNTIEKKLRQLEANVISEFPEGDTHIDLRDLPEAEQVLHEKALQIAENYQYQLKEIEDKAERDIPTLPKELPSYTEAELEIVSKSHSFICLRVS